MACNITETAVPSVSGMPHAETQLVLQMHAVQIHTNVVGGMTMTEPASDLAIAVAIASSYYEQPIARDIACIGEVGESAVAPQLVTAEYLFGVLYGRQHARRHHGTKNVLL